MKKYGRFLEMRHLYETFDLDLAARPGARRRTGWRSRSPCRSSTATRTSTRASSRSARRRWRSRSTSRPSIPTPEMLRTSLDEMPKQYVIVTPPFDAYDRHAWYPARDPKSRDWEAFRETLPASTLNVMTVRPLYQKFLLDKYPKIEDLNAAWGTQYKYFWEVPFPTTKPAGQVGGGLGRVRAAQRCRCATRASTWRRAGRPSRSSSSEKYGTVEKYNGLTGENVASLETLEPLGRDAASRRCRSPTGRSSTRSAPPFDGISSTPPTSATRGSSRRSTRTSRR